ncbi:MAG: diacylglycerol kinase family protein, partial [Candidatus Saccharibacteria bacterium]|nr:diacylglycerol kinase family protein [Candidatus Saccharibacteria bacterium]
MNRIFIVYNPRSSRFFDVKKGVLSRQKEFKGFCLGKYEVEPTDVDRNADKFAKVLKDGDFVITAGGDATGVIASNAILKSSKDVSLAVLPYGNFNDLSRTLGTKTLEDILTWTGDAAGGTPAARRREPSTVGETAAAGPVQRLYPLEIYVDGKFFRYATCYVTIGMMAEAVGLYNEPKMRKILKTKCGRNFGSYTNLAGWYFKNRRKKVFLPDFKLNGNLQPKKTSDYAAINGKYMARVMRGGEDYKSPTTFHSKTDRLTSFWRLFNFMAKSILFHVPSSETKGDILEFIEPATIELQAEGESKTF